MGSNHMHDTMRESEKERFNEINYLNTTTKHIIDEEADTQAIIKRIGEIREENSTKPQKNHDSKMIDGKQFKDNKGLVDELVKISTSQPMKVNGYLLTIKELDLPNWCYQNVHRPNKTKSGWGEMTIDILNVLGENVSEKLSPLFNVSWFTKNNINVKLEMIDPIGKVIETWEYKCELLGYEYSPLSYGSDNLDTTKLRLKPIKVKLNS